jgi:hypothetical protein
VDQKRADLYHIHVTDHACITTANGLEGRHKGLYEDSHCLSAILSPNISRHGTWNGSGINVQWVYYASAEGVASVGTFPIGIYNPRCKSVLG